MALFTCNECGKEYSKNAEKCPNCGSPNPNYVAPVTTQSVDVNVVKYKGKWSTVKLVIGILSMLLFILIAIQSCTAGVVNALSDNGATSGSSGILCAILMLAGGIVSVASRNSKGKAGAIAAIVLYWIAALLTIGTGSTFGDLPIWGSVAFSFGLINLGSILASTNTFKDPPKSKILVIIVIAISIIALVIAFISTSKSDKDISDDNGNTTSVIATTDSQDTESKGEEKANDKKGLTLGDTFKFDDLELTFGKDYSFDKVDNMFDEDDGKDVVKIPITVKNIKDESHHLSSFDLTIFGSKGAEVDDKSVYFDDSYDNAGDLRTGASYTTSIYFIYDGDGTYAIEFDDFTDKLTMEFDIKKS